MKFNKFDKLYIEQLKLKLEIEKRSETMFTIYESEEKVLGLNGFDEPTLNGNEISFQEMIREIDTIPEWTPEAKRIEILRMAQKIGLLKGE